MSELTNGEHNNDSDDDDDSESNEDDAINLPSIDGRVYEQIPQCDQRFARTLQLAVKDGINTAEGQILKLLTKASKIVSHARKHSCS